MKACEQSCSLVGMEVRTGQSQLEAGMPLVLSHSMLQGG